MLAGVVSGFCLDTNSVVALGQLQEVAICGLTADLWTMGGICALTCSICFFARS